MLGDLGSRIIDEKERLEVLAEYGVMDTDADDDLDNLVGLASTICGTPVALVSLVDDTRQWFKARVGLEAQQTPRDLAFCAHAIAAENDGIMLVEDARLDPRFAQNPLVVGDPHVVFYAGAPLVVEGGAKLGTLCVIDDKPRELTPIQLQGLETLSKLVVQNLELHRARALAEQQRDAKERAQRDLRNMFDLSLDLLCTTREGFWTKVNPAVERALGWTADELYASPSLDFIHPEDRARVREERIALQAGRPSTRFEIRYRHKNGHYRWISWSSVLEGGSVYAVGRDVTDDKFVDEARKRLAHEQNAAREMAENASRAMDQFLATVSHELRTPLNAMLGWTRLLRTEQLSDEQRPRALETIERNATMQAQLIEDLLDVSRIISGKMRLELVPVDLVSVIEAALDVVRPAADAKGVQIVPTLDPAASQVTGDSSRLQQVIWNLLTNAVKFTQRSGRVDIRLSRQGSSVEIAVVDTGAGIHADFLPHVFDRFRQADGASTRSHGGLGLGLAIVKNIAELHGGVVRAESAGLGTGSTFVVQLPLSATVELPAVSSVAAPLLGALPFDCPPEIVGMRVLIVDDEVDACELMVTILRQCGVVATSASSAEEALSAIAEHSPSVVVSDLGMPGEDGYSLIRKIRALSTDLGRHLPVIALTAYARGEDRTRALRAGFDTHVTKPIEPSELLAVIASVVNRPSGRTLG